MVINKIKSLFKLKLSIFSGSQFLTFLLRTTVTVKENQTLKWVVKLWENPKKLFNETCQWINTRKLRWVIKLYPFLKCLNPDISESTNGTSSPSTPKKFKQRINSTWKCNNKFFQTGIFKQLKIENPFLFNDLICHRWQVDEARISGFIQVTTAVLTTKFHQQLQKLIILMMTCRKRFQSGLTFF